MKENKADKLGESYDNYKDQIDSLTASQTGVKDEIKALAKAEGIEDGKRTTVTGDRYEVGYSTSDPAKVLNLKKLIRIRPDLKSVITKRVLDEEGLAKVIEDGDLTRKLLATCMEEGKDGQQRIYVKRL